MVTSEISLTTPDLLGFLNRILGDKHKSVMVFSSWAIPGILFINEAVLSLMHLIYTEKSHIIG